MGTRERIEKEREILFMAFQSENAQSHLISSSSSSSSSTSSTSSPSNPHQISNPISPSKFNTRFRLLSFLLQAVVMALVISLFFLFLGIAALLLLHFCIAGRALRRRRQRHRQPPPALDSPSGLSPKQLQTLPSFTHSSLTNSNTDSDCTVCLEGLQQGERCRILPQCGHIFHASCIDTWLAKVPACPICRTRIAGTAGVGLESTSSLRGGIRSVSLSC